MSARRPILYAHRGAASEQPENTLPSFHRAIELGADALEMDVHMTRDGTIVVSHDATGQRMAGKPSAIRDCDLSEVQSWNMSGRFPAATSMPTFEQILIEFPDVLINVDLKQRQPSLVENFLRIIDAHRATDRVCIASFSTETLRRVRRLGYRGTTALGRNEIAVFYFAPTFLARRMFPHSRAVQVPVSVGPLRFASPAFIAKCHTLGMRIDFWTINDPAEARLLLEAGADGIMTDDPATIVPVVQNFRAAK